MTFEGPETGYRANLGSALRIARTVRRLRAAASGLRDEREPIHAKLERWQELKAPELPRWSRELRDHDPRWGGLFAREAERIRSELGDAVVDVQHIGSSSIPGLRAKPILDLVITKTAPSDSPQTEKALRGLRYEPYGPSPCDREAVWYWGPLEPPALIVAHVVEEGNPWPEVAIAFRDHLRRHPDERELYERRKSELASRPGVTLLEYSLGKLALFYEITARATS